MVVEVREPPAGCGVLADEVLPRAQGREAVRIARRLGLGDGLAVAVPERQVDAEREARTVVAVLLREGGPDLEVRILPADLRLELRLRSVEAQDLLLHARMLHEGERIDGRRRGVLSRKRGVRHLEADGRGEAAERAERFLGLADGGPRFDRQVFAGVVAAFVGGAFGARRLAAFGQVVELALRLGMAGIDGEGGKETRLLAGVGEPQEGGASVRGDGAFLGADRHRVRSGVAFRCARVEGRGAGEGKGEGQRGAAEEGMRGGAEDAVEVQVEGRIVPPAFLLCRPRRTPGLEPQFVESGIADAREERGVVRGREADRVRRVHPAVAFLLPINRHRLVARAAGEEEECEGQKNHRRAQTGCAHACRGARCAQEKCGGGEDEEVEERRAEDAAELDHGERGEHLAAGFVTGEDERDESDHRRERGHQDRHHPFDGSLGDRFLRRVTGLKAFAVAVQEEDAVAEGEARDGDEADEGGDGEDGIRERDGRDAADESERDVEEGEARAPEAPDGREDESEHDDEQGGAESGEALGGAGAGRGAAGEGKRAAVAGGERGERRLESLHGVAGVRVRRRIAGDERLAASAVAEEQVGGLLGDDAGDFVKADRAALRAHEEEGSDGVLVRKVVDVAEADGDGGAARAPADFARLHAVEGGGDLFAGVAEGESRFGEGVGVVVDAQGADGHFAVGAHVGDGGLGVEGGLDVGDGGAESVGVLAEDVDRDLGLGAGEDGADAVGDRIADEDARAGDVAERLADVVADAVRIGGEVHADHVLGARHRFGVLVAFGASRAARHREDAVDLRQRRHAGFGETLRLGERGAGREGEGDVAGILAEGREEARAEGRRHAARDGAEGDGEEDDEDGRLEGEAEDRTVGRLERTRGNRIPAVLRRFLRRTPEDVREGGHEDERDEEGGGENEDVGEAEGTEEATLDAGEHRERQEDEEDDGRREEDAGEHRGGGAGDDGRLVRALRLGQGRVFREPAPDDLGEDDGGVHDVPDGDGEAADGHHVDAESEGGEAGDGGEDGEGDCREDDEQGAHLEEDEREDDDDDENGVPEDARAAVDRRADEVRLAVGLAVDFDAGVLRLGGEGVQDGVELRREGGRVAAGGLLDGQDDGGLAVVRGAAAARGAGFAQGGDVLEAERAPGRDGLAAEGREVVRARDLAERHLVPGDVGEIAGAGLGAGGAGGFDDVVEGDAVRSEFARVGLDADLGELSADHDDLADAGHGEKAAAEVVFGAGAQVKRGDGAGRGREGDEHDLAGHGDVGGDFGIGVGREGLADAGEALEDVEARAGEVRGPVEVDPDEGESAA